MVLSSPCTSVPRNPATDIRRLHQAVDRLDAVDAVHRESAARYVYDTCVYHVRRTLKTHPAKPNRGHGRREPPTVEYVFDIIFPLINRIARRLDRAMRHAELSSEPADAAALIVAVDAQGALAALFAVAQNAGCNPQHLDLLAVPLRKRSAPSLLRSLFSPDMRVTNAAVKALKQISSIECCQISTWMGSIQAALSLRTGHRTSRAVLLRNLLGRLADILHEAVKQSALTNIASSNDLSRKRSSRSSFGNLLVRQRPSLSSERRREQRRATRSEWKLIRLFKRRKKKQSSTMSTSLSRLTSESDASDRAGRKLRHDSNRTGDAGDSVAELQQLLVNQMSPTIPPATSLVSAVTESISSAHRFYGSGFHHEQPRVSLKRDSATVMYVMERLLSSRITPALEDRIEVITTLSDIASATFSGQYASSHRIEQVEEYSDAMKHVFISHGENIYSMLLSILFRPVRKSDANRMGAFLQGAGISDLVNDLSIQRPRISRFPQNAVCMPNMDCTALAAVSCNTLLKLFLKHIPELCSRRMGLITGTINSAFLYSSEALQKSQDGLSWEVSKIVGAVDSLSVLVAAIPESPDLAVAHISREPMTLRLVIENCIRSVSATGRLLAHNGARCSAPKLSDEGTRDSLRSWRALINIMPPGPQWSGSPSYSSSILFIAQAARRAALVAVMQGYRREKRDNSNISESFPENEAYPSSIAPGPSTMRTSPVSFDDTNGNGTSGLSGGAAGFEADDDCVLTTEVDEAIIALLTVPGTDPAAVFFELYRTLIYLYGYDLKKQSYHMQERAPSNFVSEPTATRNGTRTHFGRSLRSRSYGLREISTQSDEDAKGVLVDNIAVDGQLPSRALRRAVMASELDLGKYFDIGQPPTLQHLSPHQTGLPPGAHTFEELSQALAIIISALASKAITDNFEGPHEAAAMISRDVNRSGSPYLQRIHERAKSILRRDMNGQDFDWRSLRYEERIRKLEAQVAGLKAFLIHSIEIGSFGPRKRSFPKLLGAQSHEKSSVNQDQIHEYLCSPSRCFCST